MVVTGLGTFHYRVTQVGTVLTGGQDPIAPTAKARLTLVTSSSSFSPNGRDYVEAKLVSAAAQAVVPRSLAPSAQRGLSGDSSAIAPAILWGLVFGVAITIALASYRRAPKQVWAIYLLSTPLLLALALEWFSNLYLLLPATL